MSQFFSNLITRHQTTRTAPLHDAASKGLGNKINQEVNLVHPRPRSRYESETQENTLFSTETNEESTTKTPHRDSHSTSPAFSPQTPKLSESIDGHGVNAQRIRIDRSSPEYLNASQATQHLQLSNQEVGLQKVRSQPPSIETTDNQAGNSLNYQALPQHPTHSQEIEQFTHRAQSILQHLDTLNRLNLGDNSAIKKQANATSIPGSDNSPSSAKQLKSTPEHFNSTVLDSPPTQMLDTHSFSDAAFVRNYSALDNSVQEGPVIGEAALKRTHYKSQRLDAVGTSLADTASRLKAMQPKLSQRQLTQQRSEKPEQNIQVTIGSIEVKALRSELLKPTQAQTKPSGVMELSDYLKQRNKDRS